MFLVNERKHGAADVLSKASENETRLKDPQFNQTRWEISKIEIWKYSTCAKKGGKSIEPSWSLYNQSDLIFIIFILLIL
jgi:hypothetical protein